MKPIKLWGNQKDEMDGCGQKTYTWGMIMMWEVGRCVSEVSMTGGSARWRS